MDLSVANSQNRLDMERPPYANDVRSVLVAQTVATQSGLSTVEAVNRLERYGPNEIERDHHTSYVQLIANQFRSPVVYLLAVAAAVAVAFQHYQEAMAIVAVLLLNGLIGFVTELKAIRSMEAIRKLGTTQSHVRRDGMSQWVESRLLVPGDIVLLSAGDIVSADMRIISANSLQVNESLLTGESTVVDKSVEPVAVDALVADRTSMIFKGTAITRGDAEAVVTATGANSQLGHISRLVAQAGAEPSPMELQLKRLSGQLIWLTVILAALIAAIGMLAGRDTFLMIESAIALAVAAIPEGLPIVATMTLARGMWRMAQQNALVERLAAVETLGSTTVIFTDKTGTLTENKMTVAEVWLPGQQYHDLDEQAGVTSEAIGHDKRFRRLLQLGMLCNRAVLAEDNDTKTDAGDPLEVALLHVAKGSGLKRTDALSEFPEVGHRPFDNQTRMMATLHATEHGCLVAVKGAPEAVLAQSNSICDANTDDQQPLDNRTEWLSRAEEMARAGLRVLAIAEKHTPNELASVYDNLTFVGLVGFRDPARSDVPDAVRACRAAGITVVMVTGDHAATAKHIADDVGIDTKNRPAMEGHQLEALSTLGLRERENVLQTRVFARVNPAQKLDLIALHRDAGAVVAMTGDGVNDAPALRQADIGIAMGQRGTQVAREAADIVLLDDAFPTIVSAIREGRIIFDNIRKFVVYLLSCNLSEVLVVGLAILLGLPLALLPLQILFLNLVTDIFPAFALAAGEGADDMLGRKPRDPSEQLVEPHHWMDIIKYGSTITVTTLAALIIATRGLGLSDEDAITISFLTLAFAQIFHVFNMRAPSSSRLSNQVTRNPWIWGALALCTMLLLIAVYVPAIAAILSVTPPDQTGWAVIVVMSLIPLFVGQFTMLHTRDETRS